ncbi:prolyl oligopeptidase family serine peptidase [Bradyrhizobium sp. LHD-71]|uniref:prolyl oligopeptidase family serine peptidase n=1 Tax=Bradyrhizobium sp. LHD-71 TaxID=3072141 RepID=UPI00280C6730|nr:prolyl oligopeptidase family serine peptidase [Bradyrhizobium sp. LHD-71]MDQ8731623.1 prolyl oligopeptidase family serine peptidase [Bradyrhizobium sp. LHD-71]
MPIDDRPTLSAPDDDPYLWLEEIEGERALAFVARQNKLTLEKFGNAGFAKDRDTLTAIYDRPDNIPYISRRGSFVHNLWKDARNPRGLWRRTTLDEFRKAEPAWDVVLDVDKLATDENEDWILSWIKTLPESHDRVMLGLSRGGSDAVVMREFDVTTKSFVTGGFSLPEAKGGAEWLDADTLLLSSAYGDGMATTSGYARTVRLWRRGSSADQAPVIFEVPPEHMAASAGVDRTGAAPRTWFVDTIGFFDADVSLGDANGAKAKLDLPSDIWMQAHRDWFVVKRRTAWTVGGRTYPPDTLLGSSLSAFLNGDRNFTVLFEPEPRHALQGFFWSAGCVVLSILDELKPVFEVLTPSPSGWARGRLPALPEIGVVDVWRLDTDEEESNGDLLANVQDPLNPSSLTLLADMQTPTLLKRAPRTFSSDGLVVTQHEAISVDGERIPYVQTGPATETGDAPVHLNAYGGFGISSRPYYNSTTGKLWLERGGTSVIANIRGGGEFGTRWHDAGRLANKRLSHDDFAAVADDLVRRGVTQPGRIAAEGGSNGGILISNMLTRYPERFGALFCTIPLIDMRRYSKLLAGASWIAEYGDPDKPEEWDWLRTYSAYHAAVPGQLYPPILIATTRRDDRVHPGHARKMTAKLQAMGYEAYLYEPAAGGHGYGKDNKERAAFAALGYTFLREKIGWPSTPA